MRKYLITILSIFFLLISSVDAEKVKFVKCIDGDTIKVIRNGEKVTVRFLAVNAPETEKDDKKSEYYADESAKYTCDRIKNAQKIELEYDEKSNKTDKYDRLLAWVFVDDSLLQSELVEKGYAKVAYLYDDYKYTDTLIAKQEIASSKSLGIWNADAQEKYENGDIEDEETYENIEIIILILVFLGIVIIGKIFKK